MRSVFADLHVHIGRTDEGVPVKISGSRDLTFRNIAQEASERKGLDIVGIIDCHSPAVQADIARLLDRGEMQELPGGGIRYRNTTIILGSEIEVRDPGTRPFHLLAYLPDFASMRRFTGWLKRHMANVTLSSQRVRVTARELQREVTERGGILIPAHVFTPHRGLLGAGCERMAQLLDPERIAAVELGLSADTELAGWIAELDPYTFVTNSDAHSPAKIGREYNRLAVERPDYAELVKALRREDGRAVSGNFGLNPRLGKYHRTYCAACDAILDDAERSIARCARCGGTNIVQGVMDRVLSIADRPAPHVPAWKPPYIYQVPLEFIPGLGRATLNRLLDRFGTEMNILHHASYGELADAAGETIAGMIVQAREGRLAIGSGGGGKYGKVARPAD
jgi:uncharacterized protein (TIGR00375 family)